MATTSIALRVSYALLLPALAMMLACGDDSGDTRADAAPADAPATATDAAPADATPPSDASQAIAVSEARSQAAGTMVTVTGTVTVAPGVFEAFTEDKGFAIQDSSGGLYISVADTVDVAQGDLVEVTGVIGDFFMLLTVDAEASAVKRLGTGEVIEPQVLTTGEINESTEGRLVRATGTITMPVGDDLPYGYRIFMDDGSGELQVFVSASAGFDPFTVKFIEQGQQIQVTGFSAQFDDHYELDPRSLDDIMPVALP